MTRAGMLFAAYAAWRELECEVDEQLLRASGVEPAEVDVWPMEDITYDGYDQSFEFKGVKGDWTPSGEMLERYWGLGFLRMWVCYDDLNGEGVKCSRVTGEMGADGVPAEERWREKYFCAPLVGALVAARAEELGVGPEEEERL